MYFSSILSSQRMAMAFAALSGTLIFLSFCLHKSHPSISSVGKKKEMEKKKKRRKRVHFAEDLAISSEELQRKKGFILDSSPPAGRAPPPSLTSPGRGGGRMPANRVALYNGILRDRLIQRMAYSL